MTLSVLIPAYNEESTIAEIIRRVLKQPVVAQLIVVDDGSTDGTRSYIESLAGTDPRIEIILHPQNRGKGAAVRSALERVSSPICIIQDADLEYDPSDFLSVITPIQKGRSKVVFGSRVLHPENRYPLDVFRMGSFFVTHATNLLYRTQLTDAPTCYKAFETEFLKSLPLRCDGFEFCSEVTAWSKKRGASIIEVPIRYQKRSVAEGKKIGWKDGVKGVLTLLKTRIA
jgi:GT2 family glycosyltransferase